MKPIGGLGAAAASAGLDTAVPGGRFRRTLRFELVTGALATGVEILAGTRLAVTFEPREDADARAQAAPEPATLTAKGADLVVALPVARRIAGIVLDSAQAGDKLAAFRFDGPVVSEQPVATGELVSNKASLGVTDRQLVLRRLRDNVPMTLAAGEVESILVDYDAPNPRIGFDLPDDGAGAEFLSPAPPAPPGARALPADLSLGAAFAAALSTRIGRFAEDRQTPLPNPLAVDLVLEADQPCEAGVGTFELDYVLTLRGFADSAEKQVLRFPGSKPAIETIEVRLPPHAIVRAAPIALSESAGPPAQREAVPEPEAAAAAVSGEGVALVPGRFVAGRVGLAEARVVVGAEAQLAAVESAAAVASLWEENEQGLPGRKLVESAAVDFESGHPMSIRFVFPPEPLPAGPAWLVLQVERGRGVLALGTADAGAVAIQSGAGFAMADARGGAVRLLYAPLGEEEAGPSAGLTVALAGAAVALERDAGLDGFTADLAPQLEAMPRPLPARIAIEFASERKSVVTVDPPLITYEEAG